MENEHEGAVEQATPGEPVADQADGAAKDAPKDDAPKARTKRSNTGSPRQSSGHFL